MKYILLPLALALAVSSASAAVSKPAASKASDEPSNFSGTVVETTNAASYTYVLVDTGSRKLWAAAPQFQVKQGDKIEIAEGMSMPKYHSKALNRDFDMVYFTGNVKVNGSQPGSASPAMTGNLPKDHPPIGGAAAGGSSTALPKDHPPIGGAAGAPVKVTSVKKADGGNTVSEIYASKDKLSGRSVKVRGQVVKYNAMIMGKNWIHIQDGTGSTGSNDLLVTSSTDAKVGDTVLVNGKVAVNRDFGANYKYPVMIEDAKITVE